MNWIRYCNLTSIIEKHLHCIQMNTLPLKGLQKVVGHSKPKFYIYCWLFKLWCCCPLYAGQPKNSRGPNKGLPRSELGVLILTVFFCHLLYSYTIVLLYFLSFSIDNCLIQSCLSTAAEAAAGNRRQSHGNSQHSAVLSYTPFFRSLFFLKVMATINIPLSCLTLSILFQMIKKVNLG